MSQNHKSITEGQIISTQNLKEKTLCDMKFTVSYFCLENILTCQKD